MRLELIDLLQTFLAHNSCLRFMSTESSGLFRRTAPSITDRASLLISRDVVEKMHVILSHSDYQRRPFIIIFLTSPDIFNSLSFRWERNVCTQSN